MNRRHFIALFGGVAAWRGAQHAALPVVAFLNAGTAETAARYVAAFRDGLKETGYVEGQNVTVEYHWLEGHYDRLPALMADLVRRPAAVIAVPSSGPATRAAKAATGLCGTCAKPPPSWGCKSGCSTLRPSARSTPAFAALAR